MKLVQSEEEIENEYHVSWYIIAYKFLLGLFELVSGLIIAMFGKKILAKYSIQIVRELSEDPHDILANLSAKLLPQILTHNIFLIIYMIILGSVKIAGSIGLIYKQNWGVDILVGLTIIMFPFQLVDLAIHPSVADFLYISFGLLIALYLIEFKPKAWISRILTGGFGRRNQ